MKSFLPQCHWEYKCSHKLREHSRHFWEITNWFRSTLHTGHLCSSSMHILGHWETRRDRRARADTPVTVDCVTSDPWTVGIKLIQTPKLIFLWTDWENEVPPSHIQILYCIPTLPRGGMYWEMHTTSRAEGDVFPISREVFFLFLLVPLTLWQMSSDRHDTC